MADRWKPIEEMRHMTKRTPRIDGLELVTGRAKYAGDVRPDGMLYARLLTCPHPNSAILSVDTTNAAAVPGVRAVWSVLDPGEWVETPRSRRWHPGGYVAAVSAVSDAIAEDALRHVQVEYEEYPHVVRMQDAILPDAPAVQPGRPNVVLGTVEARGDIAGELSRAHRTLESVYAMPAQRHAMLEGLSVTCMWGDARELTVWLPTQALFTVRSFLMAHFDLTPDSARVVCRLVGGAFGGRLDVDDIVPITVLLAQRSGAPVRCSLSRNQHDERAGGRTSNEQKLLAGVDESGSLMALSMEAHGSGGWANSASIPGPRVYRPDAWHGRQSNIYVNTLGGGHIRAQGLVQAAWGAERLMDDLADTLGMDPLEIRLRNDVDDMRRRQLRRLADEIGWQRRGAFEPAGPLRRGLGLAAGAWDNPGANAHAEVQITSDGTIVARCGTEDLGTGVRTAIAVIVAEAAGLTVDAVTVQTGDTRLPYTPGSGGSIGMASVGPAVHVATMKALQQLYERVGQALGESPRRVEARDGRVGVAGDPGRALAWSDACRLLGSTPAYAYGVSDRALGSRGVAGCCGAEVEVDTETGRVSVVRMVSIQDCGLVVNRQGVESQILGAMVMGLSIALLEERVVDPLAGRGLNPGFEFYKIASSMDVGELVPIAWMEPDSLAQGIKGVGEPPLIPVAPAIGNAVRNAIGVPVNHLPMTPRRVLEALHTL